MRNLIMSLSLVLSASMSHAYEPNELLTGAVLEQKEGWFFLTTPVLPEFAKKISDGDFQMSVEVMKEPRTTFAGYVDEEGRAYEFTTGEVDLYLTRIELSDELKNESVIRRELVIDRKDYPKSFPQDANECEEQNLARAIVGLFNKASFNTHKAKAFTVPNLNQSIDCSKPVKVVLEFKAEEL